MVERHRSKLRKRIHELEGALRESFKGMLSYHGFTYEDPDGRHKIDFVVEINLAKAALTPAESPEEE